MIDRNRAIAVGAAAALVVIVLVTVGFVAGRASSNGDGGSDGGEAGPASATSDELPAGPAGMQDGVPVGFAHSEDGAISAGLSWFPWLLSSPASERPDGIESVLAAGADQPMPDGVSERLQYVPWAAGVEMTASDEAAVTLWGSLLRGQPGDEDLIAAVWTLTGTLAWNEDAGDWRVTAADYGDAPVEFPLSASDVEGLRVVRFTGGALAGPLLEEVPGD